MSVHRVPCLHFRNAHLFPRKEKPPLPAPLVVDSIPDLRNQIRFSASWDSGGWAHGRPEQINVYYAASAAGLPLLCFGRTQRFRNGCSGAYHKIRPHEYRPVCRPLAFNLSSRSHLNALFTCLRALSVFHLHKDRLLKEGVIEEPAIWSKEFPSPVPVVLCRVDLDTFGLFDEEGNEPDRAEQLVEARMVWDPYNSKWQWRLELVRRGWYGEELRLVGFLERGGSPFLIRDGSVVPRLITEILQLVDRVHNYVEAHPEQVRLGYSQLGEGYEQANRQLYWNEQSYRRLVKPLFELLQFRTQDYDPHLFRGAVAGFYQHPSFEREAQIVRRRRTRTKKLGLVGQRLHPEYLERLQALERDQLLWLPSWSVDQTRAVLDLYQLRRSQRVLAVLMAAVLALYFDQVERWGTQVRPRLKLLPLWRSRPNQTQPSSARGDAAVFQPIPGQARAPPDSS